MNADTQVTDRWQKYTTFALSKQSVETLANYCDEFLVHGACVCARARGCLRLMVLDAALVREGGARVRARGRLFTQLFAGVTRDCGPFGAGYRVQGTAASEEGLVQTHAPPLPLSHQELRWRVCDAVFWRIWWSS